MSVNPPPEAVANYAAQAIEYVQRSVGTSPEFDSDTLPLVDHYLSLVPDQMPDAQALAASTVGAYFGEVVRLTLGGEWLIATSDPGTWRMVLPGGLSFAPTAMALAAIRRNEDELDAALLAPPKMRPHLEDAIERMGETSEDDYYSLCGRFDTIEHLQTVLLAIAAQAVASSEA
jgi:hypothetical protein